MFDSPGLPPYPPARNAWEYPPPPVSKRWKWVTILATTLAVLAAGTMAVAAVTLGSEDFPGVIQDPDLVSVISAECELMTSTVESMPVDGPSLQQAATIIDQNKAVDQMLVAIREQRDAVSGDRPAAQWLSDWDVLLDAREKFAAALSVGRRAELRLPRDSAGAPTYRRMDDVFVDDDVCEVPEALLNPYPSPDADI